MEGDRRVAVIVGDPMSKFTIYHNPKCSKSRQTLELLKSQGIEPEVVEYLKTPLKTGEILKLLEKLDSDPQALVRTKESEFQENRPPIGTKEEVAAAIELYPKLMERPLVVSGERAVLGRPPENINVFFKN